jgi:hypothetical protein
VIIIIGVVQFIPRKPNIVGTWERVGEQRTVQGNYGDEIPNLDIGRAVVFNKDGTMEIHANTGLITTHSYRLENGIAF